MNENIDTTVDTTDDSIVVVPEVGMPEQDEPKGKYALDTDSPTVEVKKEFEEVSK